MKAVFDTKPTSIYNDDLERHYHFPSQYLPVIEQSVGDWIVFRRPKRDGGDMAYFGIARVAAIEPDASDRRMHFALLVDHLQFVRPVPWTVGNRYWEEALRSRPSSRVGVYLQGKSARGISDRDFADIVAAGLGDALSVENAANINASTESIAEARAEVQAAATEAQPREIERVLTSRIIRDASFRRVICGAYDNRCAVTGIKLFDSAGNAEAQAAHIWSVASGGPDIVQNGLALSSTVHWLFDRHLITIDNEFRLVVSTKKVPNELQASLLQNGRKLHLPRKESDWPQQGYIEKHRALFRSRMET